MITRRHIRHDWRTWVDSQTQASVKTLCNAKTRPGLAGIPGITEQEPVVMVRGTSDLGWCMSCVIRFYNGSRSSDRSPYPTEIESLETSDEIKRQYFKAWTTLHDQYDAYVQKVYGRPTNWQRIYR